MTENPTPSPAETEFDRELKRHAEQVAAQSAAPRERAPRQRAQAKRSRAHDASATRERPEMDHWAPPSMLIQPENDGDYVYRWIAEYVNGQHVPQRVSAAKRQGYEFVSIEDLPDDFIVDDDVKGDGLARVGGLILARLPRRFAEQRRAFYRNRSTQALDSANQLQGIAGANAVAENRGTRSLDGRAAGDALRQMARDSV